MTFENLEIVRRPHASLKQAVRNARTHSRKQVRKIADSIEKFGFVSPILIDGNCQIVAGHGRWQAAKLLGLADVPTLQISHLSPSQLRAYAIADNQLAALAGWDRKMLALELAKLEIAAPDLDLSITGFEIEQIEVLRDVADGEVPSREDEDLMPAPRPAVTRPGDLWLIGQHKLFCGNALARGSYERLLGAGKADLVVTDPPYNVPVNGHVTSRDHREFTMASGEMSNEEFDRFLAVMCRQLARHSRSGSLHYIFMDWRSIGALIAAGEQHYSQLLNVIAWVKPSAGMGSFYRSQHELVALFRSGSRGHVNNVMLGANGRHRSNVWQYPGAGSGGVSRELAEAHPTVKNVEMIADAIRDGSNEGDVILDPFGGSGTALIAAHRTRRQARLIELDPLYCDVILRRAMK